ncbi:Vacuolar protein sorting-associated protein 70 [Mucor velutinosus]|uniref:Vacuolar protein sorting-associated protein 70 n=1 Tax=Mucor velutinosus TaxID=708070 RepID=A0AAN7I1M3_9FUNG|nr:Vacuolar protein sorting-associated protein 70 [Mucor velutinosus]
MASFQDLPNELLTEIIGQLAVITLPQLRRRATADSGFSQLCNSNNATLLSILRSKETTIPSLLQERSTQLMAKLYLPTSPAGSFI